MAVSLMLPFSVYAEEIDANTKFDKNHDGFFNRIDWRYMKDDEKKTYARMSLEAVGENPTVIVFKNKSRETLLIEGLEAIYGKY